MVTITIYIDNFFYCLSVFVFQPIIKIKINLKSLHIKDIHPIKYIETHIVVNLTKSILIGLNII